VPSETDFRGASALFEMGLGYWPRIEAADRFDKFFGLDGFGEGSAFPKRLVRQGWGGLARQVTRPQLPMWFA
jgi:hypothetical protein